MNDGVVCWAANRRELETVMLQQNWERINNYWFEPDMGGDEDDQILTYANLCEKVRPDIDENLIEVYNLPQIRFVNNRQWEILDLI